MLLKLNIDINFNDPPETSPRRLDRPAYYAVPHGVVAPSGSAASFPPRPTVNPRIVLMVVSLVLSVCIGLVLARDGGGGGGAAVRGPAEGKDVTIGLSLDTLKEERWQADRDLFVSTAAALGATVLVQCANSDDTRQMQDVKALLASKVDVLVIAPHDSTTMAASIPQAHAEGVPVIAYDRMIRDADVDLYLSFDNVRVGELQARFLVDRLLARGKRPVKIVRLLGAPSDNNAKMFKEGQDRELAAHVQSGAIAIVHEDWADEWKPENGKKIVNAAITRAGRDIDAVLASNDGLAGGAVQALTEEGLSNVLVTGQDAELAALQRIAAGVQTMTVYKPVAELTRAAAEAAVKLAKGRPVIARDAVHNGKVDVPSILGNVVVVTRENLVQTVVKDGFHTYEEVYRSVPEQERPPRPTAGLP